ncbi:MAG: type I methionyl aminopeptidase [Ruminiclostridium sp.]|nr:type I methionyl aminopeptidase [Ruminiclostridium sp.]
MIKIKSSAELQKMLRSNEIAAQALALAGRSIKAGMSTWELDKIIHDYIVSKGAIPSSLGYCGFPNSACISVNEELIHGIPSKKKIIKEGDIVTVDVTTLFNGWQGDNARTFKVGTVSPEAERLMKVTEEALFKGIEQAIPGNRVGDISAAVQQHVESNGYHVVRQYVGHGIGTEMHEDPEVPNFGKAGRGPRLVPGMTICIEPMVNESTPEVKVLADKWTVVEANGKLSAHFEHCIAITNDKPMILTLESH